MPLHSALTSFLGLLLSLVASLTPAILGLCLLALVRPVIIRGGQHRVVTMPAIAAGMPYATYRMFRQCAFPGWVGAFDPATSLVCGAPVEQTPGGDGQDVYCDHHRGVCFTGRVQDAPRGRRQSLAQLVGNAA